MPTYPSDNPELTVEQFLNDRQVVARALTDLTYRRFAADRLLLRGTPEQVASGSVVFQRSESIFPDRDIRELALRTQYPRTGWSEQLRTAAVKKYGLETPIAYESIRRNARDQLAIGLRKIANSMVRFVDTLAVSMLLNDPDTLGGNASGDWSTGATSIKRDLIVARQAIIDVGEGYEPQTLAIGTGLEQDIMLDDELSDLYLSFIGQGGTGDPLDPNVRVPRFLGFEQVVVTPTLGSNALVLDANVAGTVADEAPAAGEGYATYNPGPGAPGAPAAAPVWTKTYDEEHTDTRVVRGVRWPAMWMQEPQAVYHIANA